MTKQEVLQSLESFRKQQSQQNKTSDIILLAIKILELYEDDNSISEESFNSILSQFENAVETF